MRTRDAGSGTAGLCPWSLLIVMALVLGAVTGAAGQPGAPGPSCSGHRCVVDAECELARNTGQIFYPESVCQGGSYCRPAYTDPLTGATVSTCTQPSDPVPDSCKSPNSTPTNPVPAECFMGACTDWPVQAFFNYFDFATVRGVVQPIANCVVERKNYDLPNNPNAFWISWGYEFTNLDGSLPTEAIFDEVNHPCDCTVFPCDCQPYRDRIAAGGPSELVNWFDEQPNNPICSAACYRNEDKFGHPSAFFPGRHDHVFFTPASGGINNRNRIWSVGTTDATRSAGVNLTDMTAIKDLYSGAPIPFCAPEIVDCAGRPGGQARYDGCGVCGGDNCGMNAAGTECINPLLDCDIRGGTQFCLPQFARARLDCAPDTTAPSITCPAPQVVECAGPGGTPVTVPVPTASATDNCQLASRTCSVPSSGPFPLGTTRAATCTAMDDTGNSSVCGIDVRVVDTKPPSITCPAPVVVECTGSRSAVATFGATAADLCGPATTSCPASGSTFPLGTTSASCSASDTAGNVSACGSSVTVRDTVAPVLSGVPGPITVTQTAPGGTPVAVPLPTASDTCEGTAPVTSNAPSLFLPGPTTVTFTARDGSGNTATATTTVTVVASPAELPGRMTGDGHIDAGGRRHDFEFQVRERANGQESGRLQYRVRALRPGRDHDDDKDDKRGPVNRFVSSAVTSVTFSDDPGIRPARHSQPAIDTVEFFGVGRLNGKPGYTFEARAADAGEPGRGRDRFRITIRDANGTVVGSVDGTLTGGNLQSHRVHP